MNVSKQEFLFEVPELYPNTDEHIAFWRQERLRCIEGYWASGYWMPGKLYFYVNYSTIKLNKQPKVKSLGKPWLRDIEWNFFRLLDEAKGFSGFIDDPDYSCHEALTKPLTDDEILLEYCTDLQTGKTIEEKFYNIYKNQFFEKKEYISPRDYLSQQHAFNKGRPLYNNQSQNLMMIGARGFGKDLHKDTLLWYEDKEAPISEVKVGDRIYNHLGELVNVTNVYTFNDQLQYEITLSDGRTIKCGAGHKWQLEERQRDGSYKTVVKELKDILPDYRYGKRGDAKYFIKYCDPIQYPHKNLPIDPYTLGALLGDGGLTQRIVFTTDDPEILREFILPENCKIKKLKSKYAYSIVKKQGKLNPLTETLKELGLFGKKSTEKFIPEVYMRSSAEQRIHLLQGLMDTDGSITKDGQIEFSQSNKYLAKQVKILCETLGIRCKLVVRKTKKRDSYRLNIITSNPIFRLQRKLERLNLKPSKYAATNRTMSAIRDIKPLKVDTSYCISVDSPDNLFLAGPCIPTHNSYMIGAVMAHEFLFDGLTKYTSQKDTKTSSEIVAGAGDAKYSSDTLDKVKLCLEHLPGEMEIRGRHFPSPFTKRYTGSWYPGKQVVASYKKKMGGTWKHVGTKSSIKHRTFKDNPFAANGTRPGIMTFEEVGMFDNLKESYAASVECQRDGAVKFGTMIFIGCVCAGTKVYTNDGKVINIEDLKQEDGILGYDGEKVVPQTINHLNPPRNKPCYRITTEGNNTLECSDDHPLLKSARKDLVYPKNKKTFLTKFVEAKDLKIGDYLFMQDKVDIFGEKDVKDARLYGLLVGDGYYGGDYISLCIDDSVIKTYINSTYKTRVKKQFFTQEKTVYTDLLIKNKKMRSKLKANSMWGQKKQTKRFPQDIHTYSKKSLSEFIAGYFDADGNVYYNKKKNTTRIVLTSVVKDLLEQMKFQLMKFGVHCSIYKEARNIEPCKGYEGQQDYIYRLYISKDEDVDRFKQEIPILHSKKVKTLSEFKKGERNFGRPDEVKWQYDPSNEKGKDFFFKENKDTFTGIKFERITEIEFLGERPVYNLNCGPTHTYISNGFVHCQTGGDMKGGGTRDAHEIFYNPKAYDCLQLEDTWEHRGKIGFFVPAYLGLNQYKNENGFTDEARAKKYLEDHRRKLLSAGSTTSLDGELINRPIKPSEIFLLKHGNIFPIHELQDRLSTIDRPEVIRYLQTPVHLYYDEKNKGGINYKVETKGNLRPINDFPFNGDDREGAVTIYEFPEVDEDGNVPKGLYIIGHDPYSSDDPAGASLASIYVLKTKKHLKYGHDEIVASFVGRPYHGRNIVNEHLMKLSMFYGDATIYFENATGNTKEFFEKYRKLHLLAKQPQTILTKRAAYEGKSPNIYGYPMSSRTMKTQAIQYLRDWLLEERGADDDGKIVRNLDRIPDKALLQELIAFNMEGNFDRVMGFAGCIIGLEETHNQYLKQNEEKSQLESAIQFFSTNRLFKQTINARF